MTDTLRIVLCTGGLLLAGCGDDSVAAPTTGCRTPSPDSKHVVTADWLNRSLTLLSYESLIDPSCAAPDAIVGTVDLAAYPPGPLELEITPDGTRAVVAVGPGFFTSLKPVPDEIPPGGTLLVVDLETRDVVFDIATQHVPMGIAISPDGRVAYTANIGEAAVMGTTLSVIDLENGTVTAEIDVGPTPEQVSLSDDGALGIVNVAGNGAVRLFQTSDPAATLTADVATGADSSDVVFIGGDRAVVANSMSASLTLLDVSDPTAPTVIESQDIGGGIPYGVTRVPLSDRVAITTFFADATLHIVDYSSGSAVVTAAIELPGGSFPLGAAIDADGSHAFVAHAQDHVLSIVDLATASARGGSWLSQGGPTYVAIQP